MSKLFGWCQGPRPHDCRGSVSSANGGLYCSCDCHREKHEKVNTHETMGGYESGPESAVTDRGLRPLLAKDK